MKKFLFVLLLLSHACLASKLSSIQKFFEGKPAKKYSRDFLEASDFYHLDWRLLPAIAMAESGGGLKCKNNNLFGWKSGRARFQSVPEGIFTVANSLSKGRRYHGRSLSAKLEIYNPHRRYPKLIDLYMKKMEN